jgi:HK97 family phage portal protein
LDKKPNFFQRFNASWKMAASWRPQTIQDLDRWMDTIVSGGVSCSGVNVNENSALTISALFSGVLQIAQTVASLPLDVYSRRGQSKKYLPQYPLNRLLRYKINPVMSAYTYKELTIVNCLLHGNAFWLVDRDPRTQRAIALWPIANSSIEIKIKGRDIQYIWKNNNEQVIIPNQSIHHVMGLTRDGIQGMSVLQLGKESLGIALAQEGFQGSYYGNGATIGGALKHPGKLSKEAHEKLSNSIKQKYQSFTNAHKVMILEEGMEYQPFQINLVDAQFIESRSFSIQEVARWLNTPPHKLKDLSRATYSNIESEQVSWLQDTIRPWLVRHEQAIITQLIPEADIMAGYYSEYNADALLRATPSARYAAYQTAVNNGWMSRDEVRAAENMNPMGGRGGKMYTIQGAMVDIEQIGSEPNQSIDQSNQSQDQTGQTDPGMMDNQDQNMDEGAVDEQPI